VQWREEERWMERAHMSLSVEGECLTPNLHNNELKVSSQWQQRSLRGVGFRETYT
jgi:hypothetical protein